MWLGILSRAWPYLAGAIALIGLAIYLNQTGYRSGYAASEAHWQPLFEAAARERDEANARASVLEARSTALSAESEKQHAESMAALQARASDAERTNRTLVRKFAARSRCGAVPEASGTPTVPDAGSASDERLAGTADRLTDVARRCESDSAQLSLLQNWIRSQQALFAE